MNALYIILIALGFTTGVLISWVDPNNRMEKNYAEEIETECIEEVDYDVEAETRTFKFLN